MSKPLSEPGSSESRLYRAESWIRRAASLRRVNDLDGQFLFYWIAFNALYGQAKYLAEDWQGEQASIHDFLGKMVRLSANARALKPMIHRVERDLVELLEIQFLRKEYWADGFTDRLDDRIHSAEDDVRKAAYGGGSLGALLIDAFDCLYVLRIQLFHGCAKDGSSANRALLEPAVAVMKRVIPLFWAVMRRAGNDESWGPLSYPAWGRAGHPEERRTRCFIMRH